jgi:hypothetical protein
MDSHEETGNQTAKEGSHLACVAIVWTQLQQVVLTAMLRQENWKLDVLFVREGMPLLDPLKQLSAMVVTLPDLSYSARAIGLYKSAGRDVINPSLGDIGAYRCLTWTLESPLSRFIFTRSACKSIDLFEDGAGSYLNQGRFGWRYGFKYVVTKALINLGLWRIHRLRKTAMEASAVVCSLFPTVLPGSGMRRRPLRRDCYRQALLDANASDREMPKLQQGAILYLPSPFADDDLLTDAEEVEVNADALRRFLHARRRPDGLVLWKPHPRANQELERERIEAVRGQLEATIQVVPAESIVEQILLANQPVELSVVSPASSSIYTLLALGNPRHRLVCVDSPLLRSRVPLMPELYEFYRRIGIEVIH